MKRILALLCVLAALFAVLTVAVHADEPLNTSLYRINDYTDTLTSDEVAEIDNRFVGFAVQNHVDLVAAVLEKLPDGFTDLEDFAAYFYDHNGFGYGDDKDGILLVVDTDADKVRLQFFGAFAARVSDKAQQNMKNTVISALNQDGVSVVSMQALIDAAQEIVDNPSFETEDWYPTDISSFERTHNPNAPLVRDDADIFTPEQEAAMAAKILNIRETYGFDITVFTDVTDRSLGHAVYAADYYFFGGYGLDEEYSGSVLLICMDPYNRGWWTAATGKCQDIYTEGVINSLDDRLQPYMIAGRDSDNANGEYGQGVLNYLDNVADLYSRVTYVPEWYPDNPDTFEPVINDPATPRVVDNAGLFTAAEKAELEATIAELRETYGADTVILTETQTTYDGSTYNHGDAFYYCNGYGGEDFKGMILCICKRPASNSVRYSVCFEGFEDEDFTMQQRMIDRLENDLLDKDDYFAGAKKFLRDAEKYYKTGKAPKNYHYKIPAIIAAIVGAIAGLVTMLSERAKMKTVAKASMAHEYIVPNSFKRRELGDMLINVVVTKTAKPKSSSSSGGGSHYSGGYSSSGGGSFSGGGRSF